MKNLLRAALALVSGIPLLLHAQQWPLKPVRVIAATGPGLATDIAARMMSEHVARTLGQPLVVENIAGAGGILAAQTAARAAPDGYTVMFGGGASVLTNMYIFKSLPYDPVKDFSVVALVADSSPFAISVNADLPVKDLPELIALAKRKPGELSYAIDVSSSFAPLIGQLVSRRTSIEMIEVPYKATPQAIQDTVTGRTSMFISSIGAVDAFVKAGKMRRIAITAARRFPGMEEIPTISETLPGVVLDGWLAVVAPVGTPQVATRRLNEAVDRFVKEPEVMKRFAALGLASKGAGTPASIADFIQAERDRWVQLVKELRIEPR